MEDKEKMKKETDWLEKIHNLNLDRSAKNMILMASRKLKTSHLFVRDLYYLLEYNEDENIVWHYTKMGVLEKILTPDNIKIRFTHSKFTNDPSECLILKEIYKDKKDDILNMLKENAIKEALNEQNTNKNEFDCYMFSTTYLKNSFTFWSKEYAGKDGIAIGLKKDLLKNELISMENIANSFYTVMEDVLYVNSLDVKRNTLNTIVQFLEASYKICSSIENLNFLDVFWSMFPPLFKHNAWKGEKELRFILYNTETKNEIEFYENKIIRCHYEYFEDKNIISSIMLAPACNDEDVKAVEKYLKDSGYNIPVERSRAFDLQDKQ